MATILPNSIEALPVFTGDVASKVNENEHAWVVRAESGDSNLRVTIHVKTAPDFPEGYLVRSFWGRLWRQRLFLGIAVRENEPLTSSGRFGVTLLAGMDPRAAGAERYQHFLWVTSDRATRSDLR